MADRISNLPDCVLCHILSFVSTRVAVSTSILSKRWQPLWRSVPTFDFNNYYGSHSRKIVDSMNAFFSSRDPLQSIRKFCLTRVPENVYELLSAAVVQHQLEHLQLHLCRKDDFPSVVLNCKTLVVLKLRSSMIKPFSSVDLPSLKVMRLNYAFFSEYRLIADLLSGCPNLEVMEVFDTRAHVNSYATEARFKKLPKLCRAVISQDLIPLEVVSNVHFLRITVSNEVKIIEDLIPQFHNLTSIEFRCESYTKDWLDVFKVLNYCPKVEHLVIDQSCHKYYNGSWDWQCPLHVPKCFFSHLKTCMIRNYGGHEAEFEFASYIMQNARVLEDMIIPTYDRRERRKFKKILSVCTILSSTCELLL